jgi:hypothetical protein
MMRDPFVSGGLYERPRKRVSAVRQFYPPALPGIESGRREWDRTTDHHHVKVVLYH